MFNSTLSKEVILNRLCFIGNSHTLLCHFASSPDDPLLQTLHNHLSLYTSAFCYTVLQHQNSQQPCSLQWLSLFAATLHVTFGCCFHHLLCLDIKFLPFSCFAGLRSLDSSSQTSHPLLPFWGYTPLNHSVADFGSFFIEGVVRAAKSSQVWCVLCCQLYHGSFWDGRGV